MSWQKTDFWKHDISLEGPFRREYIVRATFKVDNTAFQAQEITAFSPEEEKGDKQMR